MPGHRRKEEGAAFLAGLRAPSRQETRGGLQEPWETKAAEALARALGKGRGKGEYVCLVCGAVVGRVRRFGEAGARLQVIEGAKAVASVAKDTVTSNLEGLATRQSLKESVHEVRQGLDSVLALMTSSAIRHRSS